MKPYFLRMLNKLICCDVDSFSPNASFCISVLVLHEQNECSQRDPKGPHNQRRNHNNDEKAEMLSLIALIVDITPQVVESVDGGRS